MTEKTPNSSLARLLLSELLDMAAGLAALKAHIDNLKAERASVEHRIRLLEETMMTLSAGLWSKAGPDTSTDTPPSTWSRLKEAVTVASLVHRAWQMAKLVPWVGMGIEGFRLLFRLLGLH